MTSDELLILIDAYADAAWQDGHRDLQEDSLDTHVARYAVVVAVEEFERSVKEQS